MRFLISRNCGTGLERLRIVNFENTRIVAAAEFASVRAQQNLICKTKRFITTIGLIPGEVRPNFFGG